ncbi:hypothetical protein TPHA_0L01490 [Tetrapisispora phaffii CBS 4417]|uniref:glucan endo-1,3-beta-D-glucosidase n=1 Tax=Tetrapisispora phaffii (strain ATCC 24235 / CBS 4417 / NBRC 1672 / NRRL Y-8282 / UCD 70-5) TaxID=1071381 RepID=G8C026_TETPH|nr:hypothetical protein TPHA_0L01490 [Tetrapisispora phaffii CBS 4417]CCE65504.1 hypothetical protein TPHA_0L01490 [Tetrapisispora phaffii CBS 4417]
MKLATVSLAALTAVGLASADCSYVAGNYYCSNTNAIVYSNVGYSGSYKDVTSMDESSCICNQASTSFSGSLAPLNEELSVHFRGPIKLSQFGVYYPNAGTSLKKRDVADCAPVSHRHKRDVVVEWVEVTSTVFVDSNGNPVTSAAADMTSSYTKVNTIISSAQNTSPAQQNVDTAATSSSISTAVGSSSQSSTSSSAVGQSSTSSSAAAQSSSSSSTSSSAWTRRSYFTPGSTTNCTFMNHQGGVKGSGVWSSCFGNSISYAAADGITGASSAEALGDVTILSGNEFMIFSGEECSGNDCGYYRDGIPAYHGFGGGDKIFVFEFTMPSDTSGSASNQDMPAIWLLNAKIPRTLQYGDSSCSCWSTGCGEFDLFEILSVGSDKLISHIHDGQGNDGTSTGGGGTQDYFTRPTSGTLKAAVIFNSSDQTAHIVEVSDDFAESLSADTVDSWLAKAGSAAALS